jgi:dTDP-4-amino-4,6-dideoxygalactose transaminase
MGKIATFSFYPTKNLGAAGDGGMIACQDVELLKKVRALRQYGWESRYISESAGVNSRLDEFQAAILRVRLPYLDEGNARRIAIARAYDQGLARTDLVLPTKSENATHVYHQYVLRTSRRDHLRTQLRERGVGTNIHYPVPVHMQPAYAGRCEADPQGLKITEGIAGEILSLPMYPELSDAMVVNVVDTLCSLT